MLEHRSALDQFAGGAIAAPGLSVLAIADRGLLLLQSGAAGPALREALEAQAGLTLPGPLAASFTSDRALLWVAPGQWLLQLPAFSTPVVQAALAARLGAALAAVTDLSDAFACFDVGGERAADVLMTGCRLDLHPAAFGAGRVARTALADVPAVIWRRETESALRCLVDRSYAAHLWNWLAQAPGPA
jgi:sarcosine oxidase subunit gamma